MSNFNGVNYAKSVAVPVDKIDAGQMNSRVKFIYDSYAYLAAFTTADEVLSVNIPEGAFIVDAFINATDGGGTGKLTLGHKASSDATSETEDPDAFVVECDCGAAAVLAKAIVSSAKLMASMSKATQMFIACTEDTTATTGTIEFGVWYTLES